jgi:hypothetical protein
LNNLLYQLRGTWLFGGEDALLDPTPEMVFSFKPGETITPGVAYSCTVTASNAAATSAPSTPVTSTALRIDLTPILMLLLDD